MDRSVPRMFVVDTLDGTSEAEARRTLGRFETWLRCGPPGILVLERGLRPELADALTDVATAAGVRVQIVERSPVAA